MSRPKELKVISASRREEMVGFAPDRLIQFLNTRCPAEKVHSLVLWTKRPQNILHHGELNSLLSLYDQIVIHLTITGFGGTELERGIPEPEKVFVLMPELIKFIGSSERLIIRFDPVLNLTDRNGKTMSNIHLFPEYAERIADLGVTKMVTSWITPYDKVINRLKLLGYTPNVPDIREIESQAKWMSLEAEKRGVWLGGCCVPGVLPSSVCINSTVLNDLHPQGKKAIETSAQGQRDTCTCTKSWDIGWYYSCPGQCVYCYANPQIK